MLEPDLLARILLYPSERGGRKAPIVGGWRGADSFFGCPAKFHPDDFTAWDCRILNGFESLCPGETKEFGIAFFTTEIAAVFARMPKFYLWEGSIVGEATPIRLEMVVSLSRRSRPSS